jgi:hypothetical protein
LGAFDVFGGDLERSLWLTETAVYLAWMYSGKRTTVVSILLGREEQVVFGVLLRYAW